jgi:hypothetical protein
VPPKARHSRCKKSRDAYAKANKGRFPPELNRWVKFHTPPNDAKVSDGSQPPMALNSSLSESAGPHSLDRLGELSRCGHLSSAAQAWTSVLKPPYAMRLQSKGMSLGSHMALSRGSAKIFLLVASRCWRDLKTT